MAERVRGHLAQVDALVVAGTGDDTPPQGRLVCSRPARRANRSDAGLGPRAARQASRRLDASAPVRSTAPL